MWKVSGTRLLALSLLALLGLGLSHCNAGTCTPGATQACVCTDGRNGAQSCQADGGGWEACVCTGVGVDGGDADGGGISNCQSNGDCRQGQNCTNGACVSSTSTSCQADGDCRTTGTSTSIFCENKKCTAEPSTCTQVEGVYNVKLDDDGSSNSCPGALDFPKISGLKYTETIKCTIVQTGCRTKWSCNPKSSLANQEGSLDGKNSYAVELTTTRQEKFTCTFDFQRGADFRDISLGGLLVWSCKGKGADAVICKGSGTRN